VRRVTGKLHTGISWENFCKEATFCEKTQGYLFASGVRAPPPRICLRNEEKAKLRKTQSRSGEKGVGKQVEVGINGQGWLIFEEN